MNKGLMLSAAAAILLGAVQVYACGDMKNNGAAAGKAHADCPWEGPGVKVEKKAVKNGLEITVSAETAEKAAELREKAAAHRTADCPLLKGGDVAMENTGKGVKFTVTAAKAADVKKLQAMAKKGRSCCAGHEGHEGHGASAGKTQPKAAYVCPMGDYEGGDKPGRCPNCGMDLVANKTK